MALFVLSLCPFDISVGVGAFVIGLSQISSFLSLCNKIDGETCRLGNIRHQRLLYSVIFATELLLIVELFSVETSFSP